MNLADMPITQMEPMSDEEQLMEAQAWGFTTVAEFLEHMETKYQEYELALINHNQHVQETV